MSALLAALLDHYDVLKEHLRRRFGDRELAADVMQDLSVRVLEGGAHPDAEIRTPAYLLKHMSHQLAIDRYRVDATRSRLIVATDLPPDRPAADAGPEAQAISAQTGAALLAAVQALPERCREAFILVKLYDMPQAEAAKTLGISRGMVARHVANAQATLNRSWIYTLRLMQPDRNKPAAGDVDLGPYADLLRQGLPSPDAIARNARRRQRQRRVAALLAACAIAVGLGAVDPSYSQLTLATTDESATWQLADGHAVTLNRHSQAQVSLHLLSRRVMLQSGQGLFDVAHSALRSFEVQTPYARVEDIGTVFDVRVLADSVKVVVVQGLVRVHSDEPQPRDLSADQAAEFGRHGDQPTRAIRAQYATAWRRGKLIFDATPLSAVADELTRYGAPAIAFADKAAAGIAISGQFDIARAQALLDLLPTIAPVRISRRDDGTAVISSR